jgi:hypothetical protein
MEIKLTTQDIWLSTLLFGVLGGLLLLPLLFLYKNTDFKASPWQVVLASALFWGALATVAIFGFWEVYYKYFVPAWLRWLAPLDCLLYGAVGLGMGWLAALLAARLGGPAVLWFVLIGGVEGVGEHLLGIYGFHILEKVPWLQGLPTLPLLIFSFFEYVLYWGLVAWLGWGLLKVGSMIWAR